MSSRLRRALLAASWAALAAGPGFTQDEKATPSVAVSGLYRVSRVDAGTVNVSMDFSATLFNPGAKDVSGEVELRDPGVATRVWSRFGEQTIPSGGSVEISDVVSVPREIYDSWLSGDAPGIFVNIKNERGDVALHRVILSRGP